MNWVVTSGGRTPPEAPLYQPLFIKVMWYVCITGSHGGRGGAGSTYWLKDGEIDQYGSATAPITVGKAGAGTTGGKGGGGLVLIVSGTTTLNGFIKGNGKNCVPFNLTGCLLT